MSVDDTKGVGAAARFGFLSRIRRPLGRLPKITGWLVGSVLDFAIDDVCVLCRKQGTRETPIGPGSVITGPVHHRSVFGCIEITNHPVCGACAARLPAAFGSGECGYRTGACTVVTPLGDMFGELEPSVTAERPRPPGPAISVISPYMIDDDILEIIHLIKFGRYEALVGPVAKSILWAIDNFGPAPVNADVVVPVPMDPWGLKRRGFNQSERIAREIAKRADLPIRAGCLTKIARTRPQSRTRAEERADNVRGAFACPPAAAPVLAGRGVLLVDDLVTTGATVAACASALFAAGAGSVSVVCFGRAL